MGLRLAIVAASVIGCDAPAPAQAPARSLPTVTRYPVRFEEPPFVPPDAAARRAAVGPLDHLEPELRRVFTETTQFDAMRPPESGDWLDRVRERGQGFESYARSAANHPDPPGAGRDTIYILPLGTFPDGFIVEEDRVVLVRSPAPAQLEDYAQRFFAIDVEVLPALQELPTDAIRTRVRDGRDQLHAPDLVAQLIPRVPADGFALIALTNEDLYTEEKGEYAFGYAQLTGRVGVYSFARYDPLMNGNPRGDDFLEVILMRSLKIMAHEIGHMYGLEHCVHYACLMNGAADLVETDQHPPFLCPVCLRKLQFGARFDPVERYRSLAEFYRGVGFADEAAWISGRLSFVTGEY